MGKRVSKDYLQGACQRIEGALKNIKNVQQQRDLEQ
jgi:hypothetical protein